jgi:hypothetical protein
MVFRKDILSDKGLFMMLVLVVVVVRVVIHAHFVKINVYGCHDIVLLFMLLVEIFYFFATFFSLALACN